MADHKAARERCTTFLKEKTDAVDPQDLPVLDECPICLENYNQEQPVRIKIEGCNHVFGRSCLTTVLTNNPRLEKNCPLCRTPWMEAPAGAAVATVAGASATARATARAQLLDRMEAAGMPRAAQRPLQPQPRPQVTLRNFNTRTVPPRTSPATSVPAPDARTYTLGGRPRPEDRVINLIDSDNDDDPLQSFNSITRDINNVRERARVTQVSRKQRKEDKKKETAARTPYGAPMLKVKRENGSSSNSVRNNGGSSGQLQREQQQHRERHTYFNNSFWDSPPRSRPTPHNLQGRIMRNWGLTNDAKDSNQSANVAADCSKPTAMDIDEEGTAQVSEQNLATLPPPTVVPIEDRSDLMRNHDFGPVHALSPAVQQPNSRFAPRSSSLREAGVNRVPPNPFLLSPTPEIDTNDDEVAAFERDERAKDLRERANRLDARESVLKARERALDQREERILQRERSDTRSKAVRQTQLRELESMLARHHQELEDEV